MRVAVGFETLDRPVAATPPPQRTRLAGRLDMIRHSTRMFSLVLEGGETIRGVADECVIPSLAGHWGKTVVVSGLAVFRASGAVLRVEADGVEQFDGDLSIWSRAPRPVMQVMDSPTLFVPKEHAPASTPSSASGPAMKRRGVRGCTRGAFVISTKELLLLDTNMLLHLIRGNEVGQRVDSMFQFRSRENRPLISRDFDVLHPEHIQRTLIAERNESSDSSGGGSAVA